MCISISASVPYCLDGCSTLVESEDETGSKSRKEYVKACILSLCLFNLNAECIMQNAGLVEAQAGTKFALRNINNLRYADDTTLVAERVS